MGAFLPSLAAAGVLSDLDARSHVAVERLPGAVPFTATCTFVDEVGEDHFQEGHSYPFAEATCTRAGSREPPSTYIFANIDQTSTFTHGERLTLELVRLSLPLRSAPPAFSLFALRQPDSVIACLAGAS